MATHNVEPAQDSKLLFEQQRNFLTSQANLMNQPSTSSIPTDTPSPIEGPSSNGELVLYVTTEPVTDKW
jgi:hypothetical protein